MDMLNVNDIKTGDVIKIKSDSRAYIFSHGAEYNVLDKPSFGKYIVGDDGTAVFLNQLNLSHWEKVEKQPVEQPKTINLSDLKNQMRIIKHKYDDEYQLDLLKNFIDGYERGLNK